jgi:hypothetical protein
MTSKEIMLQKLSEMPDAVVSAAYLFAINYSQYGVDVTKAWTTAVQQNFALSQAYQRGYYDARKMAYDEIRGNKE